MSSMYMHIYTRVYTYVCTHEHSRTHHTHTHTHTDAMVDKARVEEAEGRVFDLQHAVRNDNDVTITS